MSLFTYSLLNHHLHCHFVSNFVRIQVEVVLEFLAEAEHPDVLYFDIFGRGPELLNVQLLKFHDGDQIRQAHRDISLKPAHFQGLHTILIVILTW